MMWLLFFTLSNIASGGLFGSLFSQNNEDGINNEFDDMVSNLFSDFYLDISLPSFQTRSNDRDPIMDRYAPFTFQHSQPLFLRMTSPQNQAPFTHRLIKTDKVNGNTWRYTLHTTGNYDNMKTYSTHKIYICHSAACSNDKSIEMDNILSDNPDRNYMHLVPTKTPLMTEDLDKFMNGALNWWNSNEMDIDSAIDHIDADFANISSVDKLLQKANDLLYPNYMNDDGQNEGKANNIPMIDSVFSVVNSLLDTKYNQPATEDMNTEQDSAASVEAMDLKDSEHEYLMVNNDDRVLVDEHETKNYHGKKDLMLIEMTVIIIFIMVCGIMYAGWRYVGDRREKRRELNYYNINNL